MSDNDAQELRDEIRELRKRIEEIGDRESQHHTEQAEKLGWLKGAASTLPQRLRSLERRIEALEGIHMRSSPGTPPP